MEHYSCLPKKAYTFNDYKLVSLRKKDILIIKEWRNAQLDILRQKQLLSDKDQENYFNSVILPTYQQQFPQQILFSILYNEVCIGYGGLVHISWEDSRAEISFLLDNQRAKDEIQYNQDFSIYLEILKKVAFKELELNRLFLETYDIRAKHIKIIENAGFLLEGRLNQHIIISNKKIDSLFHGMVKDDYYER